MSGRGIPGGGLVQRHKPEDIKVTLNLRTTTSTSTFVLDPHSANSQNSNGDIPPFYIEIHASIKYSTHPTLPVTLATWRTPLERRHPNSPKSSKVRNEGDKGKEHDIENPTSLTWVNSALTSFRSTTRTCVIARPAALGLIACRRGGYPRNLRESWDFVTLPPLSAAQSGDDKAEVVIKHLVPRKGLSIVRTTGEKAGEELRPDRGEKFVVGPSAGGLGTFWWRWGDLEDDLADKNFRADEWWDGEEGKQTPDGEGGEWVESEGENGFGLTMEVENQAEVEFIYHSPPEDPK